MTEKNEPIDGPSQEPWSGGRPSPRTKGRYVKRESWGQTFYEDPYTGKRTDD
jgi:hypothetical protein